MKVSGNCSDYHFARCACCAGCKMGFQHLNTFFHSSCSYQHFRYEDFTLEGYDPWPAIKAPMSF